MGYTKITVPENKMDIVGVQFQNIGAEGTLSLQDIKVDGYSEEGVDWIKIYDPATSLYETVYYYGEAMEGVYADDSYETLVGTGWGDTDQIVVDIDIPAGTGVWTQSETGGTLIVAGEVTSENTVSVPVNTMTLVANPLPMAVSVQDIKVDGYSEEGADWIKIYDPETSLYETIYYYGEAMEGVYADDSYETLVGPGWGDTDQIVVDRTIEVGQGFWTQAENGGILVFPAVSAE